MTNTNKQIPRSECIQGTCVNVTTGCVGECALRAAFPLDNVACGDAVAPSPRASEKAGELEEVHLLHSEEQDILLMANYHATSEDDGNYGFGAGGLLFLIRRTLAQYGHLAAGRITRQAAPEAPASEQEAPVKAGDRITDGIFTTLLDKNGATVYNALKAAGRPAQKIVSRAATTASASADTPELRRLVNEYRQACEMVQGHAVPQWRNLVDYIDNRATAPSREAPQAAAGPRMALNLNAFASYEDYDIYRSEIARLSAALAQQSTEKGAAS